MALGTRTQFQLEILTKDVISGIVYFREIIMESLRNVGETTHGPHFYQIILESHFLPRTVVR